MTHVQYDLQLYYGSNKMFQEIPNFGVEVTFVSGLDLDSVQSAFRPNTKVAWFEPCSNPTILVTDVVAIAKIAHEYNKDIIVVNDNSFLTPYVFVSRLLVNAPCDIMLHLHRNHWQQVLMWYFIPPPNI